MERPFQRSSERRRSRSAATLVAALTMILLLIHTTAVFASDDDVVTEETSEVTTVDVAVSPQETILGTDVSAEEAPADLGGPIEDAAIESSVAGDDVAATVATIDLDATTTSVNPTTVEAFAGTIVIVKTSGTGSGGLAGAEFRVTRIIDDEEVSIATVVTPDSGTVSVPISSPRAGERITVTEIQPPSGYGTAIPNSITAELNSQFRATVNFTNYPIGSLTITKVDQRTGLPLAGAHYRVIDVNGDVIVDDVSTDEEGIATVLLDRGVIAPRIAIRVIEIQPPPGYNLPYEVQQQVILDDSLSGSVTFANQSTNTLRIVKQVSSIGPQTPSPAGAYYRVTNWDGSLVVYDKLGPTDADGVIVAPIPGIRIGESVRIIEVVAPPGTVLDTDGTSCGVEDSGIANCLHVNSAIPIPTTTDTTTSSSTVTVTTGPSSTALPASTTTPVSSTVTVIPTTSTTQLLTTATSQVVPFFTGYPADVVTVTARETVMDTSYTAEQQLLARTGVPIETIIALGCLFVLAGGAAIRRPRLPGGLHR